MPGDTVAKLVFSFSEKLFVHLFFLIICPTLQVFDLMTVAALIDGQILCVHGGLSPEINSLDQIKTIDRNQEIPHKGAFCDLVWSDPEDLDVSFGTKAWNISPRGAGWLFGKQVVEVGSGLNVCLLYYFTKR